MLLSQLHRRNTTAFINSNVHLHCRNTTVYGAGNDHLHPRNTAMNTSYEHPTLYMSIAQRQGHIIPGGQTFD